MDPTRLVEQLLNDIGTLENIIIPKSVFGTNGYIKSDVFTKLTEEAKAAFTLLFLQNAKQNQYRFKLIERIPRRLNTEIRCYKLSQDSRNQLKNVRPELAVFFMTNKGRGIYFHPGKLLEEKYSPGFKHKEVDIDTDKIVPLLKKKSGYGKFYEKLNSSLF